MFLDLPARSAKPRRSGLTCLIDPGESVAAFTDVVTSAADYIDFVKFGWGTALVTSRLEEKIDVLKQHNVDFWFGGTLFEVSYQQKRVDRMVDWVKGHGARYFEISDGTLEMDHDEKLRIIRELSSEFQVLSEVGSKDGEKIMSPARWIDSIRSEVDAGAWKVIAEGRESGTAGIYRSTGEVRAGLVLEIIESGLDLGQLLFEAPQKRQQVWFIKAIGRDVNLSNIAMRDTVSVETLRLGLRSDTMNIDDDSASHVG